MVVLIVVGTACALVQALFPNFRIVYNNVFDHIIR